MQIGAVLIAAGLGEKPMQDAGGISVAQRMVSALQKAGVVMIAVVTGPEDKKLERQLAQYGVLFLRNPAPDAEETSIRMGIDYLSEKCQRLFLLSADCPLIAPQTLQQLAAIDGELVVPSYEGQLGQPVLLKPGALRCFPDIRRIASLTALGSPLHPVVVPVEDCGILPTVHHKAAYAEHDQKLTRPVLEFSVARSRPLLDKKLMALLYLIQETQSVRDACGRMQLSYSTAWNMLNTAEDALGYPLISRNKGGPSGSGSLLTQRGEKLLSAYACFENAAKSSIEKLYDTYLKDIL